MRASSIVIPFRLWLGATSTAAHHSLGCLSRLSRAFRRLSRVFRPDGPGRLAEPRGPSRDRFLGPYRWTCTGQVGVHDPRVLAAPSLGRIDHQRSLHSRYPGESTPGDVGAVRADQSERTKVHMAG